MLLVLAPKKARGSVRAGYKRRNPGRWISIVFGVAVIVIIATGLAHSTGVWTGVGYWSALWIHFLLAFGILPLVFWHLLSRPVRPQRTDVNRRAVLGFATAAAVAAAAVGGSEVVLRAVGLKGGSRRFTGSHEVASHDPAAMPTVSWFDDSTPKLDPGNWPLRIDGQPHDVAALVAQAEPLDAVLDCTGGWWSEQRWSVVPISAVLEGTGRSFEVVSATGFRRRFPIGDADSTYLAVGYEGIPLRSGHGAPVRLVAPSRRGPWWVKWVVSVEASDRPWWIQSPFPLT